MSSRWLQTEGETIGRVEVEGRSLLSSLNFVFSFLSLSLSLSLPTTKMVVQCALVLDGPPWILILIFLHQPSCLPSTKWLSRPLFFLSDSKPPKFNLFCLAFPYSFFSFFKVSRGDVTVQVSASELSKPSPLGKENSFFLSEFLSPYI